MTLFEVLSILHDDNIESFITLINDAIYTEKYELRGEYALHTGVTFKIHTDTMFELLYAPYEHVLLYQPFIAIRLPLIAGLIVEKANNRFFNLYSNDEIADKILYDDSAISKLRTNDAELYQLSYKHLFEILNKDELIVEHFPLNREYPSVIYNGKNGFKKIDE